MDWLIQNQKRSQLGQILLGKKLISEDLLNKAIEEQGRSGKRLGEILADWKVITDRQIASAIRRQRNVRLAATVATALLGPLHAYAAVAAAPAAAVSVRALNAERSEDGSGAGTPDAMAAAGVSNLRPLSDEELGEVVAQGLPEQALREQARLAEQQLGYLTGRGVQLDPAHVAVTALQSADGMRVLTEMSKLFNPLSMLLGATTTMKDVVYDPANSAAHVNKDGSITLRLPSTIGELSFKNIRVGNATSGPSFGSIDIRNIDLRGTTITVSPK